MIHDANHVCYINPSNYFNGTQGRLGESVGITMNAMNTNNTNVQSLTAAIAALTKVLEEAIDIAKEESTTATTGTTVTTTEATTTEATTEAPIIVLDDDDSVIGVGFKGSMIEQDPMDPIPAVSEAKADTAAETTTAAEANATEIKNQISVGDLDRIAEAETKKIDLTAIYEILKYSLRKEGKNQERDNSPYAPERNVMADIGHNCKIYLAEFDDEISIIIKHKDYASPLMRKTITILGDYKEYENPTLIPITASVKAEGDIKRFLDVYGYIKDLISK